MLIKFKFILLSALLFLLPPLNSTGAFIRHNDNAEPSLNAIRKLLVNAIESKQTTDSLYASLNAVKDRSALINGYIGTLEALKAKHTWNPYFKMKYLNDSEKTFKAAVSRDPHNIEIRFMRFSVEHNVPAFLGYNKNMYADRQEIIKQLDKKYYSSADRLLVKTIITFLINSKTCTPAESNNLKQHLADL